MEISFFKYEGTGNDFIIIDNRQLLFPRKNTNLVQKLCDRHFGIGADGLILLEDDNTVDFKMTYYNADGNESTMCGNGGRCIVAFANKLGIISDKAVFNAIDGLHHAAIKDNIVSLQMIDIDTIITNEKNVFVNSGSPHHIEIVENVTDFDVYKNGKAIRNDYGNEGSNVNFVQKLDSHTFKVRTYERGVEDETLACGTGVTAVAVAMHKTQKTSATNIKLPVLGGELEVSFKENNGVYTDIFLKGPATFVFKGTITI